MLHRAKKVKERKEPSTRVSKLNTKKRVFVDSGQALTKIVQPLTSSSPEEQVQASGQSLKSPDCHTCAMLRTHWDWSGHARLLQRLYCKCRPTARRSAQLGADEGSHRGLWSPSSPSGWRPEQKRVILLTSPTGKCRLPNIVVSSDTRKSPVRTAFLLHCHRSFWPCDETLGLLRSREAPRVGLELGAGRKRTEREKVSLGSSSVRASFFFLPLPVNDFGVGPIIDLRS